VTRAAAGPDSPAPFWPARHLERDRLGSPGFAGRKVPREPLTDATIGNAYRRMPAAEHVLDVYRRAGSIAAVAEHFRCASVHRGWLGGPAGKAPLDYLLREAGIEIERFAHRVAVRWAGFAPRAGQFSRRIRTVAGGDGLRIVMGRKSGARFLGIADGLGAFMRRVTGMVARLENGGSQRCRRRVARSPATKRPVRDVIGQSPTAVSASGPPTP